MSLHTSKDLIEKCFQSDYIFTIISFIDCKLENIKEMALKFALTFLSLYSKLKKSFSKKQQILYLTQKLITLTPTKKELTQIIYEFLFWTPENLNILYPRNSSIVTTLLNRSAVGEQIQKTSKKYFLSL